MNMLDSLTEFGLNIEQGHFSHTDVIVITNDFNNDNLNRAEIIGYDRGLHGIPILKLENGIHVLSLGLTIPYSDEMWNMLKTMTPKRRFEVIGDMKIHFGERESAHHLD